MAKSVAARCQTCGKESKVEWTLGMKCPECGSEKFFPVVFIDKSLSKGGKKKAVAARTQKPIGLLLVLVLFVAAMTILYLRVRSIRQPKEFRRTSTMICTNPDCPNPNPDKLFKKELPTRDVFPQVTCPSCKEKTAYRAVQCRNCGQIIALEAHGNENPTFGLTCPNCGSSDINLDSSTIPLEEGEEE